MEFPIQASVDAVHLPEASPASAAVATGDIRVDGVAHAAGAMRHVAHKIQGGGCLRTFTLDGSVGSVQVLLLSEGLPVYAQVDILQGPDSTRQGVELYSDDGRGKPVSYLLELPGRGSTVSITNTGPMEYPLTAYVLPYGPKRIEELRADAAHDGPGGHAVDDAYGQGERARYGPKDRYGRTGSARRVTAADVEMATGQKWHERGLYGTAPGGGAGPRGPPPRFADVPEGGWRVPAAGAASHSVHVQPGMSSGARYGSSVY